MGDQVAKPEKKIHHDEKDQPLPYTGGSDGCCVFPAEVIKRDEWNFKKDFDENLSDGAIEVAHSFAERINRLPLSGSNEMLGEHEQQEGRHNKEERIHALVI